MRWIVKSAIQNAISLLPEQLSLALYYRIQRIFGGLRSYDPSSRLVAGMKLWIRILATGRDPRGKTFLEVGTGRAPVLPIALYLLGSDQTFTVDLNPYMKRELVFDTLRFIRHHSDVVRDIFGDYLHRPRLNQVLYMDLGSNRSLDSILKELRIRYIAPGNAARIPLPEESIDYHISYTVFEHIPPMVLAAILREGRRISRPRALFVHKIDYSDHFAHSDCHITLVNFLRFGNRSWRFFSGNRYMYMNRLRHRDHMELFRSNGLAIVHAEPTIDARSLRALNSGQLRPHSCFLGYTAEELATIEAWICAESNSAESGGKY